ncbi:MAG TPA: hypothetical protein VGR96_16560, partial [Acidobacteriaceae bacterium]|nr:hypothetical protein [Acidobacteriaceae bacterium]
GLITLLITIVWAQTCAAQTASPDPSSGGSADPAWMQASLPDAPKGQDTSGSKPSSASREPPAAYPGVARKYGQIIEPGEASQRLSSPDKLVFSMLEAARLYTMVPALYSASYEQIVGSDPKYGSDAEAFASKFGAGMARSASKRLLADGLFAAAFHQDPRFYRVGTGGIVHRGLHSAEQALVRRSDGGSPEFNYSGFAGAAASAALVLAYYPPVSQTSGVVLRTFAISIVGNAGGDIVLEFIPDLARRFPILKRLRLE